MGNPYKNHAVTIFDFALFPFPTFNDGAALCQARLGRGMGKRDASFSIFKPPVFPFPRFCFSTFNLPLFLGSCAHMKIGNYADRFHSLNILPFNYEKPGMEKIPELL
ncbi:MAG: hypothetical protein FJ126_10280 [Deltaproteobacteria bacterium]|nr:hypothetical protein [Deltaproteobacteria bacterium]